jgi:hypothetical protein
LRKHGLVLDSQQKYEGDMRVSSEETLKRAAQLREGGHSWFELTRSREAIADGLRFFAQGTPNGHILPAAEKRTNGDRSS